MMLNSKPKISVIVPCYNVEKYLVHCLDTIRSQTLINLEVICINDGSTDETGRILADFAREDKRFVVINKTNTGYGDSMNLGLLKAKGDYIGIVESDDFIEKDMFEKLYKIAEEKKLQISRCCYYQYKQGRTTPIKNDWVPVFDTKITGSPESFRL